jgi:hypothetical protein
MNRHFFVLLALLSSVAASAADAPIVVLPNADGVLDLAGAIQAEVLDEVPNPFRVRYHPVSRIFEVPVEISAALIGPEPATASAIVNGQLCSPGDLVVGLKLSSITADALELRQGNIVLRLPVNDESKRPLKIRLSR